MAELEIFALNRALTENPIGEISESERRYHQKIGSIAEYVVGHGGVRILLLAGPSGSGKTTTANLIKDAIIARGERTIVVSLDNFYKDSTDATYPLRADGKRDPESPSALRLDEIGKTLSDIASGKSFNLPKYDFKAGGRVEKTLHSPMPDGCVIIEGLHALNPVISQGIDRERTLKLFVSVSTNINGDDGRILSGRKIRFVRRLVRDSIYRGASAKRTLDMWREVLRAEDVYLYPYKADADFAFDTFHSFELGVMKPYALGLIDEEIARESEYASIVRRALESVVEVEESLVPQNSLIREFIPGGIYESLY